MAEFAQNLFTGGLDKDTEPRFVAEGDYTESLNHRISFTDGSNQGIVENVKGNTAISVPFPSGVTGNQCLGAHEDLTTKKIYFFTVNSGETSGSCIFEYDQTTGVVTLLLTDNGLSTPVLNFSRQNLINHVDVVNGILYWTDGNNPPRKLNIARAKSNGYPTPFIEQYIEAIQYPPVDPPSGSYTTDTSIRTNNLRGKLFQFKTTFVYEDKEESAPSPTSKLILPSSPNPALQENLSTSKPTPSISAPDELQKNNLIELSFFTGSSYVKRIRIYTRVGNESDWYLYDDLDKVEQSIADNSFLLYSFYNDKALLQVDQEIIDRPFDEVPLKALCQSFIDGNRLAYSGITKGYDNLDSLNVSITPVYNAAVSGFDENVLRTLKRNSYYALGLVYSDDAGRTSFVQSDEDMKFRVKSIWETPTQRKEVGLNLSISHLAPSWAKYYEVVITKTLSISKFITLTLLPGRIFSPSNGTYKNDTFIVLDDIQRFNSVTKRDSITYNFTLGDRVRFLYGQEGPLNEYTKITEPLDFEIKTYDEGLNAIFIPRSDELFDILYSQDRITSGGVTTLNGLNVNNAQVTIEIYSPTLENEQNVFYAIGEKRQVVNRYHQGKFGFQTANQPAQLELRNIGDVYFRGRDVLRQQFTQDVIRWRALECPSYSDFYPSTFWDRGNANVVDKNQGQQNLIATSVYSEPVIFETDVNGLSTFLNSSFKDYDRRYGAIRRTYTEDKRLILFQELKVSQALVNENILYDSDNNPVGTVGQQTQVLNENTYYTGEFGIGTHPESFAVYGKVKYFVDAPRGAVLRLSQDGITKISDYKMHNYFTNLLRNVVNSATPYYIHGVYDIRFEEYVVAVARKTITESPGQVIPGPNPYYGVTIGFSEAKNRWISKYSYEPEYMVQNQTDIVTFRQGKLYTHNTNSNYNNFYGIQYNNTITFIANVSPQFVKAWQNIILKSSAPTAVTFRNENQISTLLEADFELREGRYYSTLLRDLNTPNLSFPLFEGDQLRSDYLSIELVKENDLNEFFKLFMVTTQFRASPLSK